MAQMCLEQTKNALP